MLTAETKRNADELLDWYLKRQQEIVEKIGTPGDVEFELAQLRADRDGQLELMVKCNASVGCGCGRCGR